MIGIKQNRSSKIKEAAGISSSVYKSLCLIKSERGWNDKVKRIVVVLSASRSGSSLIFRALSSAKNVVSPAGEHEPWLFLSDNKFPFTESDYLPVINKRGTLLHLLRNDLLVREDTVDAEEYADLLWNRLTINRNHLKDSVDNAKMIDETFGSSRVIDKHYWPIENPPYIDQPRARRATLEELSSQTLLFKSPSDAYRSGFYEALFPNAQITYVYLTRGFIQTVNGLMDGWSKNEIDFVSNPVGSLNIKGYSKSDITDKYWCFDLFPGWESYRDASLLEICTQQWLSAHRNILKNFPKTSQIKFENFYTEKGLFLKELEFTTGINTGDFDWSQKVMSTDKPQQFRWKKRANIFQHLADHIDSATLREVILIQKKLGYSMEEASWH